MSMDRGADDPVDAIVRGRLDRKLATPRPQKRNELVLEQPRQRPLALPTSLRATGVGEIRLAETEQGLNFGAAPFCSPPDRLSVKSAGIAMASRRAISSTSRSSTSEAVRGNRP